MKNSYYNHFMKKKYKDGKLYLIWSSMKSRCQNINNKTYHNYGGRGITVCKEWQDYKNFEIDMAPSYKSGLQLDRKNNNKGYCKENCRWITLKQNVRNTRSNVVYNGEYAVDACKRLGGASGLIRMRLNYGWSLEKAFTKPIQRK